MSEDDLKEKLGMQRFLNSKVLEVIKKSGGKQDRLQEVEFFFYTDEEDKAANLAIELNEMGYEVYEIYQLPPDTRWSVSGKTKPMKMTTRTLTKWSKKMVEVGYQHDCEFDGWGTMME